MASFPLVNVYILLLNILFVLAQQQQPPQPNLAQQQHQQSLNVHQGPPPPQQQQQQHHQQPQNPNPNHNEASHIKNSENVSGTNKNQQPGAVPIVGMFSSSYRGPASANSANQEPVHGHFVSSQPGFSTYSAYPQEVQPYTGVQQSSPQMFGLSSTGDFQLSAYFGHAFWITVSAIIIIIIIVLIFRSVGGFERLGGFVEDLQKPRKDGGRAIDLDKLTAMAYTAFDQYGKWKNPSYKKS